MSQDPEVGRGHPFEDRDHALNVALYLVLSILTCFLFDLYWNYRQMEACNDLLDRDEFSWWLWIFLVLITFGLYHFYYQYQMGRAIVEIQGRRGLPTTDGLPILSVVATLLGFGIVTDCIHQLEINRIVD
ncbi:MAG: DUF4234 domain-containing protein [bacterium]|nr:DUF4234 domain-containing protein [bacterium]MCP5040101.1 DUF4234 domain-containing protein [bacterium]